MSEVPFYQTRAGRTFYESTMPALVVELARLNSLLEKLVARLPEHPVGGSQGQETEQP